MWHFKVMLQFLLKLLHTNMFLPKLSGYLWSKSLEYAILMKVIKARICVHRIE